MRGTAQPLRITIEALEDARLVRVAGEIDKSTVAALRRELDVACAEPATVLLDLSEVSFIDSSGLRLLLDASRTSAVTGWPFFIVRPSAVVQRLIHVSRTADELALVEPTSQRVLG